MRIFYAVSFLAMVILQGCSKQTVEFGSSQTTFESIQIQKFDSVTRSGRGPIYQGEYSENRDTIYFHVTHFPDEEAPSYNDWQLQASLYPGSRVSPSLGGVKDMDNPMHYTITAPNGIDQSDVVVQLLIYEVDFLELDYGFGRYNKLFELTAGELGWNGNNQTSLAVVDNELVVNNMDQQLLVYNKRTGEKINKNIPMPEGQNLNTLFVDDSGVLHATGAVSFSSDVTPTLKIYRWVNGIDNAPELFYELPTADIPITGNGGIGLTASVAGSTQGEAQIMLDIDGRGDADSRAVRIEIKDGFPLSDPKVFDTGVGTIWSGKAIAMSPTEPLPYAAVMLGFPPKVVYVDNTGTHEFNTDPANSNFLNKLIGGAHYFEFNSARYLAMSSISWPGDYNLLLFNLDDATLINVGKSESSQYNILNPFVETAGFMSGADSGDVTVQVQPDGKTAILYLLGTNSGISAFELTNVGSAD